MQILLVTPFYAPEWKFGGPPRKISSLAKELAHRGHDVRVVTFHSERPNERGELKIDSIDVQYLPWLGTGLRQCPRALRLLRQEIETASIVHCFGLYNLISPVAGWLALRSSTPFVIEPMGMFVPRVRSLFLKRIYNLIFTRWLFRNAAAVVATSELEGEELRRSAATGHVVIRRNGVSLDYGGDVPDRITTRTNLGIAVEDQLIGYLGRISKKKRLLELIEAFDDVSFRNTKLLIAGPVSESDYFNQVKQRVHVSPRANDIIIKGLLEGSEYVAALKVLDLFVLPSENENFGNSAAEAVLTGVPVLLTRDCGVAPILDQRVGLAVDQGVDALRRGLEFMLTPDTRNRWAPHWEKVQKELSWEEPVRTMETIYESIVSTDRG